MIQSRQRSTGAGCVHAAQAGRFCCGAESEGATPSCSCGGGSGLGGASNVSRNCRARLSSARLRQGHQPFSLAMSRTTCTPQQQLEHRAMSCTTCLMCQQLEHVPAGSARRDQHEIDASACTTYLPTPCKLPEEHLGQGLLAGAHVQEGQARAPRQEVLWRLAHLMVHLRTHNWSAAYSRASHLQQAGHPDHRGQQASNFCSTVQCSAAQRSAAPETQWRFAGPDQAGAYRVDDLCLQHGVPPCEAAPQAPLLRDLRHLAGAIPIRSCTTRMPSSRCHGR